MSQSILIGSNKVTEADVIRVPAVPFTNSFHPVHHRNVIDAIRSGVVATGLEIVNTDYVLANNGNRMFGVWDLSGGNDELCWSIGIRNSMDKSMALGITAGTRPMPPVARTIRSAKYASISGATPTSSARTRPSLVGVN